MVIVKQSGDFNNVDKFFKKVINPNYLSILEKYAREGVIALSLATPVDTGLTATSWNYEIASSGDSFTIAWTNSHIVDGVPIAIILQYGHGTRNGGYVQGRDYINPATLLVVKELADSAWKEVTNS